jgi:PAS domain S-box-containing protein
MNCHRLASLFLLLLEFSFLPARDAFSATGIGLTGDERAWISAHPELRVASETDWPPFDFQENGTPRGYSIDLIKLVASKAGFEPVFVSAPAWDELLEKFKAGDIDIMPAIFETEARKAHMSFTTGYFSQPSVMVVNSNSTGIRELSDIRGKRVALVRGYAITDHLQTRFPDIVAVPVDRMVDGLTAVSTGTADVFIETLGPLSWHVENNFIPDIRFIADAGLDEVARASLHMAVASDRAILRDILQKAIDSISREEKQRLRERWLGGVRPDLQPKPGLVFTDRERQWIREHPVISLGVDPAWPPFDFIDGQGAHSGMAADFLQLLGRRLGIRIEMVPGLDWEEVLQRVRERSLDLVSLSQETPERREYLSFTDTVSSVPWAVVTQKDFKKISGLDSLSARRVAVVKSYAIVNMLRSEYPDIEIHEVGSSLDGLRAVASGQVDAMVENLAVASYLISENSLINLKIAADSGFELIRLGFGVRSDWPELVGLLNKALASLTRDEIRSVQGRWTALEAELPGESGTGPEWATWLVWTVLAVFLLLVVVAWLLMRFVSGERLASRIGSARFHASVLVSLSVFVVLVLFLGWLAVERIEGRIRHDAGANLENSLSTTIQRLNFWAAQRQGSVRQLGRHPRLVEITQALLALPPQRDALLASRPLQQARAFFSDDSLDLFDHLGFFIISPEYINVGSMRDSNLGERNLIAGSMPDLLPRVFRGEAVFVPSIVSDVSLPASSGATAATMFFVAPVRTGDGAVIAALALRIDPGGEFSRVLQFSRVGDSGDSYAFNRQGQLLSASRFHRELQEIGLIGKDESEILRVGIRDPGGNLNEGYQPADPRSGLPLTLMAASAIRMADSREGVLTHEQTVLHNTDGYRDYRGVPVFGAWTWHDGMGMGVASEIDVDEALATFYSIRNTVFTILAVTLLLSVAGTLLMLIVGQRANRVLSRARDELELRVDERTAELKQSEATLRKSREEISAIMNATVVGLITIDEAGIVKSFNPAAEQLFGYAKQEVIGHNVSMLMPEPNRSRHDGYLRHYRETGEARIIGNRREETGQRKDGSTFPIDLDISEAFTPSGHIYVGGIRDISERKQAEKEIHTARLAAEEANQAKSAFLANMSHELRTPMNAILGYSEMLMEEAEDLGHEDFIPDLKKINQAGTHLLALINDVLDLSKIEAGRMEAYAEDIDVSTLVDEVAATAQPLMSRNNNRLIIERGEGLGYVHQDLTKLRQTLFNLLSNAAKFTREGCVTLRVRREHRDGGDWLVLEVSDTGIGISADKLEHVFDEFSQADSSTTRNYGGTGLGLAITRRFCQLLGGDIILQSQPGEGSTFTIGLPVILPGTTPRQVPAEAAPVKTKAELEAIRAAGRGHTILVIDDDPEASDIIRRFLEKDGFTAVTAGSGEEGLRLPWT